MDEYNKITEQEEPDDEQLCKGYFEENYCKNCWLYSVCSSGEQSCFYFESTDKDYNEDCNEEYYYSDEDYDDECREIFDRYRCKGCKYYDECFYNDCAAEVESDNLYRAMQGEPLDKIFSGTDVNVNEDERISTGELPF